VLDLTLLAAAQRAGMAALAEGLETERLALKPLRRPPAPLALAA
jgi:hypothetical protein